MTVEGDLSLHPAQSWLRGLLDDLRVNFMRSYKESLRHGVSKLERGDRLWGSTIDSANKAVKFADLLVATKIRYRATGKPLDVAKSGSDRFDWREILRRNPWMDRHQAQVVPIMEERVWALVSAERDHADRLARVLSEPKLREEADKSLARADMMYRHATTEIANVSEQVEMSVPEVGDAFPYGEYLTRDDRRVRPTHRAMYGFVAPRTNEIWGSIRPPNGFNCRCFVAWVTWREAIKRGWATEKRELRLGVHWPNTASRRNYAANEFPDAGWRGPKLIAG